METKFTPDFIEEQRELAAHATPRSWSYYSCRRCGQIWCDDYPIATVTQGEWGDTYPVIKDGKACMASSYYGKIPDALARANEEYIVEACNNYPDALEEIERLKKEIMKMEAEMETKYTKEFIEQQRKYIDVYDGNVCWFDGNNIVYVKDYDPDKDEFQYGKFGEVGSPEEAEAVASALIDYPDALDEIERLQALLELTYQKVHNAKDQLPEEGQEVLFTLVKRGVNKLTCSGVFTDGNFVSDEDKIIKGYIFWCDMPDLEKIYEAQKKADEGYCE